MFDVTRFKMPPTPTGRSVWKALRAAGCPRGMALGSAVAVSAGNAATRVLLLLPGGEVVIDHAIALVAKAVDRHLAPDAPSAPPAG